MAESGIDLIWRAWYLDAPLCNNKRRLHQDRANQVLASSSRYFINTRLSTMISESNWYQCPNASKSISVTIMTIAVHPTVATEKPIHTNDVMPSQGA